MSTPKKFSIQDRLKSFTYSWDGIKALLRTEHNTYIHLVCMVLAFALGFVLRISRIEFMVLVVVVFMVLVAEVFNTAIEKTMDFISLEKHPQIKLVKDLASAAVLLTAVGAVIVGLLIFVPKLL